MSDLRDDFEGLRERDRENAPAFDAMMARRPPPRPRRTSPLVYVLPAAAALAMAAAFVLWITTATSDREPPPLHAKTPSDPEPLGFLLDEPAALARVPDFDSSPIHDRRR